MENIYNLFMGNHIKTEHLLKVIKVAAQSLFSQVHQGTIACMTAVALVLTQTASAATSDWSPAPNENSVRPTVVQQTQFYDAVVRTLAEDKDFPGTLIIDPTNLKTWADVSQAMTKTIRDSVDPTFNSAAPRKGESLSQWHQRRESDQSKIDSLIDTIKAESEQNIANIEAISFMLNGNAIPSRVSAKSPACLVIGSRANESYIQNRLLSKSKLPDNGGQLKWQPSFLSAVGTAYNWQTLLLHEIGHCAGQVKLLSQEAGGSDQQANTIQTSIQASYSFLGSSPEENFADLYASLLKLQHGLRPADRLVMDMKAHAGMRYVSLLWGDTRHDTGNALTSLAHLVEKGDVTQESLHNLSPSHVARYAWQLFTRLSGCMSTRYQAGTAAKRVTAIIDNIQQGTERPNAIYVPNSQERIVANNILQFFIKSQIFSPEHQGAFEATQEQYQASNRGSAQFLQTCPAPAP